ncbi:DUF2865 domain-containing protein [Faunimonas sp. B44]|uniref:DUF2865 domain-containing protein n=1 Tax=Faunimonas sp. B44 TaxID=3461493 RepID=UPI0040449A8F
MEANLARLDQMRARAGGSASAGDIRQIRAQMARQGCGAEGVTTARRGSGTLRDLPDAAEPRQSFAGRGTYRTLCVRSCDGYYFPVSFATGRENFTRDLDACQALCPGTRVDLFYHPNPGTESEAMVSLAGVPYSELPNAFKYRKTFDKSCSCGAPRGAYSVVATRTDAPPSPAVTGSTAAPANAALPPLPLARPGYGEDPETVDNRLGGFTPGPALQPALVESPSGPGGRNVRIVGPAYWGGQRAEEVLLTPVPN